MRALSILLSGIILVAFAAGSRAQEGEPEVDCQNAMSQVEMNVCADRDYQVADAELNKAYRATMAAMEAKDKDLADLGANHAGAVAALKKAQRAWIAYRDGQCALAGFEARGGSMEPMLVSACLADLTRRRTAELKGLVEGQGN